MKNSQVANVEPRCGVEREREGRKASDAIEVFKPAGDFGLVASMNSGR